MFWLWPEGKVSLGRAIAVALMMALIAAVFFIALDIAGGAS
jgi:hypothetical protein